MTLRWRPGFADAWSPSSISTVLWLDAADASTITKVNGAVSQWNDKSGNGRNVSQATSANRPTYAATGLNGLPTIDWGSTANGKNLAFSGSAFTPARIYGVAEWDGPDPFPNSSASDSHCGLVSFNLTANNDLLITELNSSLWYLNGSLPVFLNGATASSGTALPTVSSPFVFGTDYTPSTSRTNVWIGNDRALTNPGRGWRGKISEIIIPASAPNTATKEQLEGYLAHKWGLTVNLPSGHPYKNDAPRTAYVPGKMVLARPSGAGWRITPS